MDSEMPKEDQEGTTAAAAARALSFALSARKAREMVSVLTAEGWVQVRGGSEVGVEQRAKLLP